MNPDTLARWWVQLNGRVWPPDLPGKPNPPFGATRHQLDNARRGALAVVNEFVDHDKAMALWRDTTARRALLFPEDAW